MFTRAIVRPPAPNFSRGLSSAGLGAPDYERALEQHEAYCAGLRQCGLRIIALAPDENYPDSTFVEDAAILTDRCAVLTRPGAPSRAGEVASMRQALTEFFPDLNTIEAPGTVDGGDVCEAGSHFFIGLSERTNEAGAQQLTVLLERFGYTCSSVDIRSESSLLHLKSGIAYLGDNRLVVTETFASRAELASYDRFVVNDAEAYAANCVSINDYVLVAAGYPLFTQKLRELGYQTIALEMSEFQKMDGGLSCLSLRF
ncbi:MAG TPA: N(G),N(G)-dimethylarginine dimethylaminohydrolase [Blastocatellia bacterium]|nr:N(G),N(G)-dimethylarginine dimethylaminohydrolase [Blastocatellia bacterium]